MLLFLSYGIVYDKIKPTGRSSNLHEYIYHHSSAYDFLGENMEPVKLAMVGCGENAKKSIVKEVNRSETVQIIAAMDIKLDLAKDIADEAGAAMATFTCTNGYPGCT